MFLMVSSLCPSTLVLLDPFILCKACIVYARSSPIYGILEWSWTASEVEREVSTYNGRLFSNPFRIRIRWHGVDRRGLYRLECVAHQQSRLATLTAALWVFADKECTTWSSTEFILSSVTCAYTTYSHIDAAASICTAGGVKSSTGPMVPRLRYISICVLCQTTSDARASSRQPCYIFTTCSSHSERRPTLLPSLSADRTRPRRTQTERGKRARDTTYVLHFYGEKNNLNRVGTRHEQRGSCPRHDDDRVRISAGQTRCT